MLTGRIADWGLHRPGNRHGTHLIEVDTPVDSVMDWGMLGYFAGQVAGERIPVLAGRLGAPDLSPRKHCGAAAASSGGVETYHVVGVTPEAPTLEVAFGPRRPPAGVRYGVAEMRRVYDELNSKAAVLLAGRRVSGNCRLWICTSRAARHQAERLGSAAQIRAAGGLLLTDTCSSISQAIPPGTQVAALDSAKQVHYLPACMGGVAEGEALVTRQTISGWGGINPMQGTIIETRHELRGQSFRGKVLVFPAAKGSSGWSAVFHMARLAGTAPLALLFNEMTTKIALGAIVMRIPAVTDLDRDPLELIETGDWLRIDGDRGIVEGHKIPPRG